MCSTELLFSKWATLFADSSLTIENLVKVMDKVTSDETVRRQMWGDVLKWGIFNPISSCFDMVYSSDKEKTAALADVYVNIRPESSWQHLVDTVYLHGQMAAAKEAKSFLQQIGG